MTIQWNLSVTESTDTLRPNIFAFNIQRFYFLRGKIYQDGPVGAETLRP